MRFLVSTAIHGFFVFLAFSLASRPPAEKPAPPVVSFPQLPKVGLGSKAQAAVLKAGGPTRPKKAKPSIFHRDVVATQAVEPAAGGGPEGSGEAAEGSNSGEPTGGGEGDQVGGTSTFTVLSRPPSRIFGDAAPMLASAMVSALRGSKGVILVRIWLTSEGNVDHAEIVQSSMPALDANVLRHVATWRFEPPMVAGRTAAVQFLQPFSFSF